MDINEYFKLIKDRPSPWAIKHKLSPALICRARKGMRVRPDSAKKISEASGNAIPIDSLLWPKPRR